MAEAFIVSHGALAVGGVVALAFGGLLLFDTDNDAYEVSVPIVIFTAALLGSFFVWIASKAVETRHRKVHTGAEELIGAHGEVRSADHVFVQGALWRARSDQPLEPGQKVVVRSIDGLTLTVATRVLARLGRPVAVVLTIVGVLVFFLVIVLASAVRVLREYERGVIFRLGRLIDSKGPGLILLIPIIDRMVRVDLRTVTLSIPPQEVITRDNVPASVTAVCYFKVVNPRDAIVQVENYLLATSQIAQTTLRAVLGRAELDTLLSERDRLNDELQRIIDEQTEPWGIKVTTVEIKDVEIPSTMQRAMARQAEAERERRAKIIAAEGEFQAADKLSQAAELIGKHPVAIQLRYLQTLLEIGSEHNSTTIFPVPIELFRPFIEATASASADRPPA